MSREDLIWTGSLNDAYAIRGHVGLYDTTLRDGEQTVGVVLDPQQKLEIARLLDELGIDRIEAGFPRVSEDDRQAVKLISEAKLSAEVWGFSRAVPADLEVLVELGVSHTVIESPISDLKLDAIGVSRETMLERIANAMRFAAEHGIYTAFFGVDSTRADLEFFRRAYETAVETGAREVAVVDTLGIASPEAVGDLVGRTIQWLDGTPVHFHGHNDFGVATASAAAAVRAGATWVHGTINGMGERAGNANLDFFRQAYETAVEAGAREVAVVDTLGIAGPEAVADLLARTRQWLDGTPVHFHGHNDFGLATASAVAAVRSGATWLHGTVNGMGERAGNANLGELALTLRAVYGVESNLRLDRIRAVSERVRELSGYDLEPWKPLTGQNLFRRESGAVASQFHDPPSIEPYSSELVSAERSIVLGKKSGIDSIRIKAAELGVDVADEAALLAAVKQRGTEKRGLVTDDEFRALADGL